MGQTRVKICGLSEPQHVAAAVAGGVAYVGFVFFEKSPRNVTPKEAWALAIDVPPGVAKVVLTVDATDAELLIADIHVRAVLGLEDDGKRVHFGELNDSLTCMRAHGKPINSHLTASDLNLINRLVRTQGALGNMYPYPWMPESRSLHAC